MNIEIDGSEEPTIVSYGLVLRMDLEMIPDLKRYLAEHGIRIAYQLKTTDRIRVVRDSESFPAAISGGVGRA